MGGGKIPAKIPTVSFDGPLATKFADVRPSSTKRLKILFYQDDRGRPVKKNPRNFSVPRVFLAPREGSSDSLGLTSVCQHLASPTSGVWSGDVRKSTGRRIAMEIFSIGLFIGHDTSWTPTDSVGIDGRCDSLDNAYDPSVLGSGSFDISGGPYQYGWPLLPVGHDSDARRFHAVTDEIVLRGNCALQSERAI